VSALYAREYDGALPTYSQDLIERYRSEGWWRDETITERLRSVADASPDRIAVVDGSVRLGYGELVERIDAVRRGLASLGLGRGDYVTVQLPNWWELVVAMFAIVETGAVFVPTNVRMRGDLEYVLSYTGSRALLMPDTFHGFSYTELAASFEERLPNLQHVIVVRPDADPAAGMSFDALAALGVSSDGDTPDRPRLSGLDPWQIIFTSGTTSAPKGVLRTHDNTLWTMRNLVEHYGLFRGDGSDVALAVLPIAFIFAQYLNELGVLMYGGTLVLQERFDAAGALDLIEQEGVTYTGVVPSMVPTFLDVPGILDRSFPTMRVVCPAGEAVTRERKEQLEEIFGCATCECYGLAEMTWPLAQRPDSDVERRMSTTGFPSPGAELRVVDDDGNDVGVDEVGELLLRGPTLFPGYYKNPEATAAAIDADGWFRSGDLVRLDADGYYSICGRKKDLIKRSGIQVLPQEIEDALEEHPAVHAVGVVGLADDRRGEIACACVVLKPDETVEPEELLEFLRGRLATYKLPERIELMEALPLSPNGKVLKNELRARVLEAPAV
jgi:non-ribosomal peptide synthetase component E (peptide arylation enzyme)